MADEPQKTEEQQKPADTTPPVTDPPQAPTDGENPEKPDVTFTPEQQKQLDKILSEKLGKVKERTTAETAALQKQIEERDEIIRTNREGRVRKAR